MYKYNYTDNGNTLFTKKSVKSAHFRPGVDKSSATNRLATPDSKSRIEQ